MSKGAVRDYFAFDAEAYQRAYAEARDERGAIFRERRRIVLGLLKDPPGRVLDVGSGPGVFTPHLLDREASCCTLDLSSAMLLAARRAIRDAVSADKNSFVTGDIESLPFEDRSFDSILCVGVLQYLDQISNAIHEMARCVVPGGQVIVTFPNRKSPLNLLHSVTVRSARAAHAASRRLGVGIDVSALRLTFRRDIPNRSFTVSEVVGLAARSQLKVETVAYHCLRFPFSVPGLSAVVRLWNEHVPAGVLSGTGRGWGREAIIRFIRV